MGTRKAPSLHSTIVTMFRLAVVLILVAVASADHSDWADQTDQTITQWVGNQEPVAELAQLPLDSEPVDAAPASAPNKAIAKKKTAVETILVHGLSAKQRTAKVKEIDAKVAKLNISEKSAKVHRKKHAKVQKKAVTAIETSL